MIKLNHFVEVPEEMIVQLQEVLAGIQAGIQELTGRVEFLEQAGSQLGEQVENLSIGLEEAALAFDEDQAFGEFNSQFGEKLAPFAPNMKALHGEDYDFARDMFALSREQEDVGAFVEESIEKVKAALIAAAQGLEEVQEIVEGAELGDSVVEADDAPIPTEEQALGLSEEEMAAAAGQVQISPEVEALLAQSQI